METNVLAYLEKTSALFPKKVAVRYLDSSLSFDALKNNSRALSRKILVTNVAVGVFANRSIYTAVGFLSVLYSGNYYVPLDPDIPIEKLKDIIDDANLTYIIGEGINQDRLCEISYAGQFIDYMTINEADGFSCSEIDTHPTSEQAYMVYTSGSTGKPKGVLKSHKAIISYIEAFCNTFSFSSEEVIGNQTSFYFDASAKDFYLMLKTGATLELIPTEYFSMPTQLIEFMNEKRISFISWVPTAISIVAQLNPFSLVQPKYLRRVFFVGEVMPMKHLNKWRKALPDIQYVNLYGQSEIAGVCCYHVVSGEYEDSETLPMGKPLTNCKVYLVGNEGIIDKPGIIGELFIVSDAIATEYYRDDEKTQHSFLLKDFGNGLERCFKTGDLAEYDENGDLIFTTRSDFQIKHMGHRIELGEIEAIAGSIEEIARCCCLYNQEKKKIILFVELMNGVTIESKKIQSILRSKLSNYMVPGKVILCEKLPINANGKIDRRLLFEKM